MSSDVLAVGSSPCCCVAATAACGADHVHEDDADAAAAATNWRNASRLSDKTFNAETTCDPAAKRTKLVRNSSMAWLGGTQDYRLVVGSLRFFFRGKRQEVSLTTCLRSAHQMPLKMNRNCAEPSAIEKSD